VVTIQRKPGIVVARVCSRHEERLTVTVEVKAHTILHACKVQSFVEKIDNDWTGAAGRLANSRAFIAASAGRRRGWGRRRRRIATIRVSIVLDDGAVAVAIPISHKGVDGSTVSKRSGMGVHMFSHTVELTNSNEIVDRLIGAPIVGIPLNSECGNRVRWGRTLRCDFAKSFSVGMIV